MAYIASQALTHFNVADTPLTLKLEDSQTEQEVEITVPATTIR